MTKDAKSIIKKDLKKYKTLLNYTEEKNREAFYKIVNYLENILEEEEI